MDIQWYPGHMTKAMRQMQANIKLVDLVIELVDARCPKSSSNPELDRLGQGKSRMIVMTKADLADQEKNIAWKSAFEDEGKVVVQCDVRNKKSCTDVLRAIDTVCAEKRERDAKKGIRKRPVRAIVVGIPNVGKSTFINSLSGRTSAKTGNKPGVTKGQQWIRMGSAELLDTPGVLWPKFEDQNVGMCLAAIGSISDDVLDIEDIATWLIKTLSLKYPDAVNRRYDIEDGNACEMLSMIAVNKSCIKKGGEPDTLRAAKMLLDDFRAGRLGRITLD